MRSLVSSRGGFRWLVLLVLAILLAGCGSGSNSDIQEPTQPPATAASTPHEPVESEDDGDEGGGNLVSRSLRTGGNWVWSGLTWVWDRGSDGANAVWDAIGGAGSFLWSTVRGLPSDAWHQIQRFWTWLWGTDLGSSVAEAAAAIPEIIAEINPIGFVQGLVSALVRILKISMAVVAGGLILFIIWRFRLLGVLVSAVFRRRTPSARVISKSGTEWNGDVESPSRGSISKSTAQLSSSSPLPVDLENSSEVHALPWTRTQIQELKARIANRTILALFDLALARGGEPVNYLELMEATDRTREQVRADFAAFSRVAREVHRDESWPVDIVAPTDQKSNRAYSVPEHYLDWWFQD